MWIPSTTEDSPSQCNSLFLSDSMRIARIIHKYFVVFYARFYVWKVF